MELPYCLLVLALLGGPSLAGKIPADFQICNEDLENIDECLTKAVQVDVAKLKQGIPNLKVPSVDPLFIESATIAAGSGTVNFVQNYKNMKFYGISDARIDDVKLSYADDKKTAKIVVTALVPELRLEAEYTFNGKLLLLPIVGSGPSLITLKNTKVVLGLDLESFEKNGKEYLKVTKTKVTLGPELMTVNFENLFNGDKTLGDQINTVLNDQWKDVFADVRSGYEELVANVLLNFANLVFSSTERDNLLPR